MLILCMLLTTADTARAVGSEVVVEVTETTEEVDFSKIDLKQALTLLKVR